jgi:hypothetical protein
LLSFGAEFLVFQFAVQKLKFKIYRTIILPVVVYGRETWSLTLVGGGETQVEGV